MFCTSLCGGLQTNVVLGMNRAEFVKLMMAELRGERSAPASVPLVHRTQSTDVYFYAFSQTFSHVTVLMKELTGLCLFV